MFESREIERNLFRTPEVDCNDYEHFPEVDDEAFMGMESEFISDESKVHVFSFLSYTFNGKAYIEIYVWDCMLYPECYQRFLICEGMRLGDSDEKLFLHFVEEAKPKGNAIVHMNDKFNTDVGKEYPKWHYVDYDCYHLSEALCHLYFASHRSGVREILYKANLNNIAYNIESIPGYNLLGSSPTSILDFGLPIKLIRILNQRSLIHNLYADDTIESCREVYVKYSSYIGKELISSAQWSYLEMLYYNNGMFGGTGFSRALYKRLEHEWGDGIVTEYGRFLELKGKLPGVHLRLPKPEDVEDVADGLDTAYKYKTDKTYENSLIRKRYKESSYEYCYEDYMVTLPKDGLDMCMEAIMQGNCLMDYIKSHAESNTTIAFVRKRNDPKTPFVTMEISGHCITQVFGKYNVLPYKEVFMFLEEYAKAKGLLFSPWDLIRDPIDDYDCIDDDLWEYFEDFRERHKYPTFSYEEIECFQMSLQDCFPDLIEEVKPSA